jgi:hypothetical protein
MANGATTYSFKDLVGSFISPIVGSFILAGGKIGAGKVVINMTLQKSEIDMADDGAPMTSYIAGDNGEFTVDCQQTSALHKFFLNAFNAHKTAADSDDVSEWAQCSANYRNILDGTEHECSNVSFTQIPPKSYDARGGMVAWKFLAGDIQSL